MPETKLSIEPERCLSWEQWEAGRAERRRIGNLVAPAVIRRKKSEGDDYLRETYSGERGPAFKKAFDPSAEGL